jgi:hypothetical protein
MSRVSFKGVSQVLWPSVVQSANKAGVDTTGWVLKRTAGNAIQIQTEGGYTVSDWWANAREADTGLRAMRVGFWAVSGSLFPSKG